MLTPRNPRWKIAGALSVALAGVAIVAACNVDRPTELRRTAPAEQPTTEPLSTPADGEFAYEAAVLQRSPELINRAEIAERMRRLYPRLLLDASIEGESLFEFVIQADGSVDPRSVKLVSATHEQFGAVGHHIVEAFRFQPGEYRDSDVRVLVRMPVKWEIPD